MPRIPFNKQLAKLSDDEKISLARDRTKELTYRIQNCLELFAACELVCYSDHLANQVSKTHAAEAFAILQRALFEQLVVKILSLWDKPEDNSISIPTVCLLIDSQSVIQQLCGEAFDDNYLKEPHKFAATSDTEFNADITFEIRRIRNTFAMERSEKAKSSLLNCVRAAKEIRNQERHEGLSNLRDRVVHSLTRPRREEAGKIHVARYGYEKQLLLESCTIIEELYCWINGTSYKIIDDQLKTAQADASALWHNLIYSRQEDI